MALKDVYRVDFMTINDDKLTMTSIHYEETVVTTGTALEVATAVAELSEVKFWTDFWQTHASDQLLYLETRCQMVYPDRDVPAISVALAGESGSDIEPSMNGTTAVLVALYSQLWSAFFRGRAFLPGLPETDADVGRIGQTAFDLIQADATTFYEAPIIPTAPAGGAFLPVIFSPTLAAEDPPPAVVTSFIDTVILRARIATQRSRRTPVRSAST